MSRPSDHYDSPAPLAADDVTQPRLGFVGWLRWFWRQLTNMRTALFLLLLLGELTTARYFPVTFFRNLEELRSIRKKPEHTRLKTHFLISFQIMYSVKAARSNQAIPLLFPCLVCCQMLLTTRVTGQTSQAQAQLHILLLQLAYIQISVHTVYKDMISWD